MFRVLIFSFLVVILLGACAVAAMPVEPNPEDPVTSPPDDGYPAPKDEPEGFEPRDADINLGRAEAYIDTADLLIMESHPVQIMLSLTGSTPTPCHQLRIMVSPPDENNNILIEVYSVFDPDQICIMVLESFVANVNLGSFPAGTYTVQVNGEKIGEFES